MKKMKKIIHLAFALCICLVCSQSLMAQEQPQATPPAQGGLDDETLKKANDPLAHTKALNVHNYVISSLYGVPDASANQLLIRYAQPIGPILLRATMPFVVNNIPNTSPTTGFGDFNLFAIYSHELSPGNKIGIGPLITAPTGSHNMGAGKWQAGISALAFLASNRVLQMGSLLQWQASFASTDDGKDRPDVNQLTAQMFFMWQLGGGTYLRSTGIWSFDLTGTGNYNVPIGLGIGKVVKVGGVVFNIFAEPQFSVLASGEGQPRFQTFVGFNTQF